MGELGSETRFGRETIETLRSVLPRHARRDVEPGRRPAAVLIPLFLGSGRVHVVLTRRTHSVRSHKGQVSFPGGAREVEDPNLEFTALREAEEEISLAPERVEIIGVLDDMPTAGSNYVIRPVVGLIGDADGLVPHPPEVARILTPPLDVFADPANRRIETWERDGVRYPVIFYDDVDGELVWGATARLLVALLDRLEGRDPEPVRIPTTPDDG